MKFVSGVWNRVKISSKSAIPTTGPVSTAGATAASWLGGRLTFAAGSDIGSAGAAAFTRVRERLAGALRGSVVSDRFPVRPPRLRGWPGPFELLRRTGGSIGYTSG